MNLTKFAVDSGFMVMFSDFALKALITDWDEKLLGPNPFIMVSEFGSKFELKFNPDDLKACPSVQLQKVGELCENGIAQVHAMPGTIFYTVNYEKIRTRDYSVQILTVATNLNGMKPQLEKNACQVSGSSEVGAAGHVLITYPTGGFILTSCGHWVELSKLDVSIDKLLSVASNDFGEEMRKEIETQYKSAPMGSVAQANVLQSYAQMFVQQAQPCQNAMSFQQQQVKFPNNNNNNKKF